MSLDVRPVRASEWREARDLRLRALQDPDAHLAFFARYEDAVDRPDSEWQEITARSSIDAPEPQLAHQVVAVTEDGQWVGTGTCLIKRAGEPAFGGGTLDRDAGHIVAVWVAPEHRGGSVATMVVGTLLNFAAEEHGIGYSTLWVHEDNVRAQRFYARMGFAPTGRRVVEAIGPEIEMALDLLA